MLRVYGRRAATPVALSLPAADWTRSGSATKPRYRYSDKRRGSGTRHGRHGEGRLAAREGQGRGALLAPGAPQGTMTCGSHLGDGAVLCAVAPAKDPATSNDTTARFNGVRQSPPPVSCPPVPAP